VFGRDGLPLFLAVHEEAYRTPWPSAAIGSSCGRRWNGAGHGRIR
jgi:hypothetical protein